ncbi:hypothetical protein Droror1_Dr00003929 [Drosera rotundifolia]
MLNLIMFYLFGGRCSSIVCVDCCVEIDVYMCNIWIDYMCIIYEFRFLGSVGSIYLIVLAGTQLDSVCSLSFLNWGFVLCICSLLSYCLLCYMNGFVVGFCDYDLLL